MKIFKIWMAVTMLILAFTFLMYLEYNSGASEMIYSRHLFYVPIILAGVFYGAPGGVFAGLLAIASFSPILLLEIEKGGFGPQAVEHTLTLVVFTVLGITSGMISQKVFYIRRIYQSLHGLEKALNNPNGVDEVLNEVNKIFNSGVAFFIAEKDGKHLVLGKNRDGDFQETKNIVLPKESLLYQLLKEGKGFNSINIFHDKRLSIGIRDVAHSDLYICVAPVAYLKNQHGLVVILKEEKISQDDFKLLQSIAKNIAINFQNKKLYISTITDNLTKAFNRRYFDSKLEHLLGYLPEKEAFLAMLDIDFFKKVNDGYGHSKGDEVLRKITTIFKGVAKENPVCRYGGEEFAIIFSGAERESVLATAEQIRTECERNLLYLFPDKRLTTVSIGIASYPKDAKSPEELIKKADEALYKAKEGGRNRVIISS